jgi:cobalt-zinc-cadmium efflux system membrane fusion protein
MTSNPLPGPSPTSSPAEGPKDSAPSEAHETQGTTRRRRVIAAVLGLVVLAGGALVMRRAPSSEEAAPTVKPDVPVVEGKHIVFSPAFRDRAGLVFASVENAPLVPRLRVVGTVDFDPAHVAAVGTRIPGLVRKLSRVEGERVKKDEVLAEIESADLGEAQANLAVADAQRAAAETNERRERELAKRGLTTSRELEVAVASNQAQRALLDAARQKVVAMTGGTGAALGSVLLRSPLEGTIVERAVHAGQFVDAHLVAFRVANLDHLWVDLAVFESNLESIRKGDPVDLLRAGAPDDPLVGHVAYVGEVIDPVNRTAAVRIAVDNEHRKLRPGQSVTATIRASGPSRTMLAVPLTAITYIDGKPTVFRSEGADRVTPVRVELGPEDGKLQGVSDGLAAGDSVVTQGVFALKSELYR